MKQIKNYSLSSASIHIVQILYFHEKKLDINSSMQLGKPFPNPSSGEVTFNLFSVSSSQARLEIFDLMGRKIHHADYSTKGNEINSLHWSGADLNGQKAAAGLYLYKLITYSDGSPKTSQGRIIIR